MCVSKDRLWLSKLRVSSNGYGYEVEHMYNEALVLMNLPVFKKHVHLTIRGGEGLDSNDLSEDLRGYMLQTLDTRVFGFVPKSHNIPTVIPKGQEVFFDPAKGSGTENSYEAGLVLSYAAELFLRNLSIQHWLLTPKNMNQLGFPWMPRPFSHYT